MLQLSSFQGDEELIFINGYRESAQVGIGRPVLHYPFVIEFAAVSRALQPVPENLQFCTLVGTAHV
jgi:hypothetical protein